MKTLSSEESTYWLLTQLLAAVMGIMLPLVLLGIVHYNVWSHSPITGRDWIFYLLLILGAVEPGYVPVIRKSFLRRAAKLTARKSPAYWAFSLYNVRFSMTGAIFIYGIGAYFLWHDLGRMLWFYPIGLVWTAIYWPRKKEFTAFVEEMGRNVTTA